MYRDARDTCPRCGVSLIDARAARGCPDCKGLWVAMPDLSAMALRMHEIPRPVELPFVAHQRAPLPCPECKAPMGTWMLFGTEIDRCDKHGVWFDPEELAQVLMAVWIHSSRP